jgi:hypothetical protein
VLIHVFRVGRHSSDLSNSFTYATEQNEEFEENANKVERYKS